MLINSAQYSGLYSHPWPLLIDIDSDLSAPKNQGRRAIIYVVHKQNSQRINMAGWGRVCTFLSYTSVFHYDENQREADSCRDGQHTAF